MTYSFESELATKYGVDEAVMLQNFIFWIKKNKANNKHYHDGHYWTYNSHAAFVELFPFWSEGQIKRILKSLIDKGLLIKGNFNQHKWDQTRWYALDENIFFHWLISTNGAERTCQPIPDSIPDSKHIPPIANAITPKGDTEVKPLRGKKTFIPPTLEEWLDYAKTKNLDKDRLTSAWEAYNLNEWHDSRGQPIRNWKSKMLMVWDKPENKSFEDLSLDVPPMRCPE